MEWYNIVINILILLLGFAIGLLLKNFFPSYTNKKGENLATKEDVQEITKLTESVKSEFTYQIKSYEFYKSGYDKELRDILDYWFNLVKITCMKDNKNLDLPTKNRLNTEYQKLIRIEEIAKYKMNTLKYGGTETSKVLALQNKLQQSQYSKQPNETIFYIFCKILSVIKKEIIGQELDPLIIIQTLVNDYDENEKDIKKAQKYVEELYKKY